MKRVIFQEPIELTNEAINIDLYIRMNDGEHTDSTLAELLNISDREVREIIERINYLKYNGINKKYQIRKINGKYTVIDFNSEHKERVLNKIKFDMIASIKRYGITSDILSDVSMLNLTISEIMNMEVEDED